MVRPSISAIRFVRESRRLLQDCDPNNVTQPLGRGGVLRWGPVGPYSEQVRITFVVV
jgi:hypothetical protein